MKRERHRVSFECLNLPVLARKVLRAAARGLITIAILVLGVSFRERQK